MSNVCRCNHSYFCDDYCDFPIVNAIFTLYPGRKRVWRNVCSAVCGLIKIFKNYNFPICFQIPAVQMRPTPANRGQILSMQPQPNAAAQKSEYSKFWVVVRYSEFWVVLRYSEFWVVLVSQYFEFWLVWLIVWASGMVVWPDYARITRSQSVISLKLQETRTISRHHKRAPLLRRNLREDR